MKTRGFYVTSAVVFLALLATIHAPFPTASAAPSVTQCAAGSDFSFFIMSDGSLWGMGDNQSGQLGLGFPHPSNNVPGQVESSGVVAVAAGGQFSLFIKSGGSLWAMGDDFYGELGDGGFMNQYSPEEIESSQVSVISAGDYHSLFGKYHSPEGPGSLWAMGWNQYAQLGDGTTTSTNTPQQIVFTSFFGSPAVMAVAAGYYHSLFIRPGGSLWAMGGNSVGQLGDGTTINQDVPEKIIASNVVAVAAGYFHSLFFKSDGSLWAMGENTFGQLGDGTTMNQHLPQQIVASNVVTVAAGSEHSLFIKSDGSLWGMGQTFGLGIGLSTVTNVPIQILAGNVVAVAAGGSYSIFIKSDGSLWAMGDNSYGQLGDPRVPFSLFPIEIVPLAPIANGGFETGDYTAWRTNGNVTYTAVTSKSLYVHSGRFGAESGPIGSLGYLSQNLFTVPETDYLLSLWLNSPDGETPNEFRVSWNGTTLFDQTNLPAIGWTNILLEAAATGTNTVLQFGFRNDNSYFGLDDVSLVTLVQPVITGIKLAGVNLRLNAGRGQAGGTYFVLSSTNVALPLSQWSRVATNVLSLNGDFTITAANAISPGVAQQFYILQQQN